MFDAIIAAVVIIGGFVAAFLFGKRKERKANDIDTENTRIATEGRIKGAIRDVENTGHSWRDSLHKRK